MDNFWKKLSWGGLIAAILITVVGLALSATKTKEPEVNPPADEAYDPLQQEEPASAASAPQANPFNL